MWLLGLRDLQWRRRRFTIAVLATALVFAMTLLLTGVSASLENEVRRIVRLFDADAWLVAEGTSGPFTTANVLGADTAQRVATAPGVEDADPVVLTRSTIGGSELRDVNVIGFALNGIWEPDVVEGRAPRAPGEVVADTSLGVDVGEAVELGDRRLEVVGHAKDIAYGFGVPTLVLPIEDAQRLVFRGQPLAMAVITQGIPDREPPGLDVLSSEQVESDLRRPMKSGTQSIRFINVLLWVVAAGIVGSIVYLSALERVRDFAVLKATGAGNRTLLGALAFQAVVLSGAAAVLAAVMSWPLGAAFPFEVEVPGSAYPQLTAVAVGVGLLASLAGLRRAVAVDPALAFGGAG